MIKALREKWETLSGQQRTLAVRGGVVAVLLVVVLGSYYLSGRSDRPVQTTKQEKPHPIKLGDDLVEDEMRASLRKYREEQREKEQVQAKTMEDLKKHTENLEGVVKELKEAKLDGQLPKPAADAQKGLPLVEGKFKYPPPPPPAGGAKPVAASSLNEEMPTYIGDIERVSNDKKDDKKDGAKKKRTIYLPPGFMDAMLLTGLKAATVQNAKNEPEPMMFRVQAPAVLPNEVKADLKGCFVIANGFGRLDAERVDARLVSISCLAHDGEAVIDASIKGYVADKSDGTKGLKGVPVSKMGANMARVFLAGVFGGMGNAVRANNTTVAISPLGATSAQTSGEQVVKAGIGEGISDAAADVRKVFLDLVRQSSPVIEVGPAKEATIVITEGVNLEIRDYDNAGDRRAPH